VRWSSLRATEREGGLAVAVLRMRSKGFFLSRGGRCPASSIEEPQKPKKQVAPLLWSTPSTRVSPSVPEVVAVSLRDLLGLYALFGSPCAGASPCSDVLRSADLAAFFSAIVTFLRVAAMGNVSASLLREASAARRQGAKDRRPRAGAGWSRWLLADAGVAVRWRSGIRRR